MSANALTVAVVVAVLNEEASVERLLDALHAQTRRPDCVIFADGGSTDGTLEKIAAMMPRLSFGVEVRYVPGNISKARNHAIALAGCDIIAVTDADCVPHECWLAELTAPIVTGTAWAVGGSYFALAATPAERAIASFTCVPQTEATNRFLPSHRSVAYLKKVWTALGGYDETIDSGEDTLFDLEVEKRFPWAVAPRARVAWKPRASVRAAIWQQIYYGAGDGQARIQRTYHASVLMYVLAEIALLAAPIALRAVAAVIVASAIAFFDAKRRRMFGPFPSDLAYVAVLALVLPPARLAGFALGLCGGSVRAIRSRS